MKGIPGTSFVYTWRLGPLPASLISHHISRLGRPLQRRLPSGTMRKSVVCFLCSLVPSTAFHPAPHAGGVAKGSRMERVHVLNAVKRDTAVLPDLSQVLYRIPSELSLVHTVETLICPGFG